MSSAYYNELDGYPAAWLRNLAAAGHIAAGTVDARSIKEVQPRDLDGYRQCHFFAGLGAWSYALRLAGWPDSVPVWTGSCPCQPFSAAGAGGGFDDERHLWPDWFRLIRECRPAIIFGEQVASPAGLAWLDLVSADLEGEGYAVGAADLCAAGVGAPHLRQRLYFVAVTDGRGSQERWSENGGRIPQRAVRGAPGSSIGAAASESGAYIGVAIADRQRRDGLDALLRGRGPQQDRAEAARCGEAGDVADDIGEGLEGKQRDRPTEGAVERGSIADPWSDAEWIPCLDGKSRPVEPGTFPLAHGAPARVGRLRAYGNAIVPEVAATFIRAVMETL